MSPLLLQADILPMFDKVRYIWPEVAMFLTTCVVMVLGLSRGLSVRKLTASVCGVGLVVSGLLALFMTPPGHGMMPGLLPYAKTLIAGVGLLLLLLTPGTVDRAEEAHIASGHINFNPLRTVRAEFYAFFMFSLTGLMLCATANDLVWLFLALELTSLPTYIMVTVSQDGKRGAKSQEAGVKYFFLGALGAAVFLYGFALLYGGTGTTDLTVMRDILAAQSASGGINAIALLGLLMALIGVGFKIAAVPMHLYTPDVYEGAASPVSAFLAFVPKTAGFLAIILLASVVGWTHARGPGLEANSLPEIVRLALWVMAALTMTVGNVLAVLQNNVKRMLAYSSIAHSGYMLVGIIAGPGDGRIFSNGLGAVLFYLLVYGVSNIGAFAVLASLERRAAATGEPVEIETVDDLRGLCHTHPVLGWTMVLSALSLMGFPPLLGFFGKIPLFTSAIHAGEIPLVIVLGLNSAIAAYYYLRLVFLPYLDTPTDHSRTAAPSPFVARRFGALAGAVGVVVLILFASTLMQASNRASAQTTLAAPPAVVQPAAEHPVDAHEPAPGETHSH